MRKPLYDDHDKPIPQDETIDETAADPASQPKTEA